MSKHRYKHGDIITITSKGYNVFNCRAEVTMMEGSRVREIRPLDGQKFDHGHFSTKGKHYIIDGDIYEPYKAPVFLDEGLFTI